MKALTSEDLEQVSGGFDLSGLSFERSDFRDFRISPLALNAETPSPGASAQGRFLPMGVAPPQYAEPAQIDNNANHANMGHLTELSAAGTRPFQLHNVQDEFREALLQDGPERSYATINTGWFRSRFLNR